MRVMVTGHRPNKLGGYNKSDQLNQKIITALKSRLERLQANHPDLEACSGMALGVDQWWADLCSQLKIPWIAFIPCAGQWNRWPQSSRDEWHRIIQGAKDVRMVSNKPYWNGCMQARNLAMVNWTCWLDRETGMQGMHNTLPGLCVAVWNGTGGGTYNAIQTCRLLNVEVDIIDPTQL